MTVGCHVIHSGPRLHSHSKDAAKTQSPGEHLQSEIRRLSLDQAKLSAAIGVSRQSINNIINGRQPVSRAMAKKLGALTGRADDYWLRNTFRRPKEIVVSPKQVVKPLQKVVKRSRKRKTKRITEPFCSFVLKLPDALQSELVNEIKSNPNLPAVATWAQLRFYLAQQGADDVKLVAARRLWQSYRK